VYFRMMPPLKNYTKSIQLSNYRHLLIIKVLTFSLLLNLTLEINDELAKRYKHRVGLFIKDVSAVCCGILSDDYNRTACYI
jgi:hypothetical protein